MSVSIGKRVCPKCNKRRPLDHFNRHRRECKSCRAAAQRRYVANNRERVYARNREWRDAGGRRRSTVAVYGITVEEYDAILAEQGGVCAICERACPTGRSLAVDHDHASGRVRGLLCARCNPGIGYFADSPGLLEAAIRYLSREEAAHA